ncbi:Dimethyl-sulfide monooxygenase [Cyberlindnera fabianii]|uniref:Dimethyl-sulfide monooxygenase n=1 Tax=Cyberlindnera fabianii TaxID=36022 RepID=A0A1V2L3Z9_CYBFA|nr:Dimethyl-sulfide monooxygenase [Cyberlindnera fabianii]
MDVREGRVLPIVKKPRLVRPKKPLVLNLFTQGCVNTQSAGLWTLPGDVATNYNTLDYWINLAKKAEAAKFNAIFIADVLGPYDVYKGPKNYSFGARAATQFPGIDPAIPISAMASVTKSLGFGITFSTISEHPYLLARKLATLDFMTSGRVGWNIVSSYLESASRNLLNGEPLPEKTVRYAKTDEYVQVVVELLLSSFRTDAVKADPKTKIYADPDLIRTIDFEGQWYKVPGPSYTSPTPQGIPVLFHAGTSPSGIETAAKWGECAFSNGNSPTILRYKSDKIHDIASQRYGRDRDSIKILVLVVVIVAETEEKAWEKFNRYAEYTDHEAALAMIGGWMNTDLSKYDDDVDLLKIDNVKDREIAKHFCADIIGDGPITKKTLARHVSVKGSSDLVIGNVEQVVQRLVDYVEVGGADGFNFAGPANPETYDDVIDLVLPELKKRGYMWEDYPVPGGTLRENLTGEKGHTHIQEGHPAFGYTWTPKLGDKDEFKKHLDHHKEELARAQAKPLES